MEDKTGFKILTWNINGLRSFGDFPQVLRSLDADILCFQETKVTRDQLPEPLALIPGYSSYYAFTRNGSGAYSGVATYVRNSCTPVAAEEGVTGYLFQTGTGSMGCDSLLQREFSQEELKSLDGEGRCVITKHQISSQNSNEEKKYLVIINVYCPRADPERDDRKTFKLHFYKALDIRANSFAEEGNYVIVLGDINTSHREIDHCDPYDEFPDHPGRRFLTHFLNNDAGNGEKNTDKPEDIKELADECEDDLEAWQCQLVNIKEHQFHDSFRIFHGSREQAFTCWNTKMNCRSTNYGTRIDYIFVNDTLKSFVRNCDIHPEVVGSDHCPVAALVDLKLEAAVKPPPAATKYYPEFQGRQLSIKDMLSKSTNNTTGSTSMKRQNSESGNQPAKKPKPVKITNFFTKKQDVNVNTESKSDYSAVLKVVTENVEAGSQSISEGLSFAAERKIVSEQNKQAWSKLFQPPKPTPLCSGHQEECVKRKVTKKGSNQGREFYCCARGEGRADDPQARCNFFKWAKNKI